MLTLCYKCSKKREDIEDAGMAYIEAVCDDCNEESFCCRFVSIDAELNDHQAPFGAAWQSEW